jgi:hypothetical protein
VVTGRFPSDEWNDTEYTVPCFFSNLEEAKTVANYLWYCMDTRKRDFGDTIVRVNEYKLHQIDISSIKKINNSFATGAPIDDSTERTMYDNVIAMDKHTVYTADSENLVNIGAEYKYAEMQGGKSAHDEQLDNKLRNKAEEIYSKDRRDSWKDPDTYAASATYDSRQQFGDPYNYSSTKPNPFYFASRQRRENEKNAKSLEKPKQTVETKEKPQPGHPDYPAYLQSLMDAKKKK